MSLSVDRQLRRAWLRLLVCLPALWFPTAPLAAHGLPPAPVAIVAQDAQAPRIVRLAAGFALRHTDGAYRYVCPALWGDVESLPAYALPGQPAVVLSSAGLWLLHEDGRVSAHPDPLAAAGSPFDLAAVSGKLYVLRSPDRRSSELVEVTAERVTRVWQDAALWTTLAAGDDFLAVARLSEDDQLVQQTLSTSGVPRQRMQAAAPAGSVNVLARAAGSDVYLVLANHAGRQLGRLGADGFEMLQSARATIAGPVHGEDGRVYVALDGKLALLQGGSLLQLEEASGANVSCLGCYERQCYACTGAGVQPLTAAGLDAPTFELAQLAPPQLDGLSGELESACDLQWEHLRFDLLGLGIEPREPAPLSPTAGNLAPAAGSGPTAGRNAPAADSGEGCSVGARPSGAHALELLALLWFLRRRAKSQPGQRIRVLQQLEQRAHPRLETDELHAHPVAQASARRHTARDHRLGHEGREITTDFEGDVDRGAGGHRDGRTQE